MLAVMLSDLVILIGFFLGDIKLGSDYNEFFVKFEDKITIIHN